MTILKFFDIFILAKSLQSLIEFAIIWEFKEKIKKNFEYFTSASLPLYVVKSNQMLLKNSNPKGGLNIFKYYFYCYERGYKVSLGEEDKIRRLCGSAPRILIMASSRIIAFNLLSLKSPPPRFWRRRFHIYSYLVIKDQALL